MTYNGYVYETFGISKHFPVKLQVLLIRAETLDKPLTAKCFIYDVGNWCKKTDDQTESVWSSVFLHLLPTNIYKNVTIIS